jgi:hypothetical protein
MTEEKKVMKSKSKFVLGILVGMILGILTMLLVLGLFFAECNYLRGHNAFRGRCFCCAGNSGGDALKTGVLFQTRFAEWLREGVLL